MRAKMMSAMKLRAALVCLLAAVMYGAAPIARAQDHGFYTFDLCNPTETDAWVAIVRYEHPDSKYAINEGWWGLKRGACEQWHGPLGAKITTKIWYSAYGGKYTWWAADTPAHPTWCVQRAAQYRFELLPGRKCLPNETRAAFQEVVVQKAPTRMNLSEPR
jgi:uncharacterized membrane protein